MLRALLLGVVGFHGPSGLGSKGSKAQTLNPRRSVALGARFQALRCSGFGVVGVRDLGLCSLGLLSHRVGVRLPRYFDMARQARKLGAS